jgi:acyl-CoA thioesterase-1
MRRPRTAEARADGWVTPSSITAGVVAMVWATLVSCSQTPAAAPPEGSGGSGLAADASSSGGSGPGPDARAAQDSVSTGADARSAPPADAADVTEADATSGGPKVPATGVAKIMVLGSSNETGTCWRAFLWQKLRAAGVMSFDFVGRTNVGPDCGVPGYDKDVEAAPGTIITGFSANDFAVRFKANPPDVVLVHVGGADARDGVAIPKILAAYSLAVEQARVVSPHVIFYVAQHTPQQPPTGIHELNAAIPGWAAQTSTPESPVFAVDLFTGIVPATDQSDGTHLNDAGSQKVAGWWLAAILPLFKP